MTDKTEPAVSPTLSPSALAGADRMARRMGGRFVPNEPAADAPPLDAEWFVKAVKHEPAKEPAADMVERMAKAAHHARYPETVETWHDFWDVQLAEPSKERWRKVASTILALSATPAPSAEPVANWQDFRDMATWDQRDEVVLLLVDYSDDGEHPLDDADKAITIGHNNDHNVGEGEGCGWQFAGWSWQQDCYTEGRGKPIGWAPLPHHLALDSTPEATPQPTPAQVRADALREAADEAHRIGVRWAEDAKCSETSWKVGLDIQKHILALIGDATP